MTKVINTYTRESDGHIIDVYESGAERDRTAGRMCKPAAGTLITAQNTAEYNRRRQEKTAALLRARIAEEHAAAMPNPTRTAAEAIADSGAMLYSQIVLNSEAYPRDRLQAWETLGKYARTLPADIRQAGDPDGQAVRLQALTAAANVETVRIMERVFRDVKAQQARQTVEGKVVE